MMTIKKSNLSTENYANLVEFDGMMPLATRKGRAGWLCATVAGEQQHRGAEFNNKLHIK
jgi:hypothetical protein